MHRRLSLGQHQVSPAGQSCPDDSFWFSVNIKYVKQQQQKKVQKYKHLQFE